MKRTQRILAVLTFCVACSTVSGMYSVSNRGTWPQSWPKELEPLRKQSRSLTGPMASHRHYEIPFTKREDFEAAWPHLLTVKSKGAPVFLRYATESGVFHLKAGVVIHCPAQRTGKPAEPEEPLAGNWKDNLRTRWMYTNFIELVVDGDIVDLNRIRLPAETPIIDERFKKK